MTGYERQAYHDLRRVADALERIAAALEPTKPTPEAVQKAWDQVVEHERRGMAKDDEEAA